MKETKHFISVGYYDQQELAPPILFKRFPVNMSLDNQVADTLKPVFLSMPVIPIHYRRIQGWLLFQCHIWFPGKQSFRLYPYKPDGTCITVIDRFAKGSGNNPTGDNFLYSASITTTGQNSSRASVKVYGELNLMKWCW